jgi:peptidoglycan/xylan/chitin deacetylase (PgdA/CDA1 family)
LKTLAEKNVKATFHISLEWIHFPKYSDVVKDIVSQGHAIGLRFHSGVDPRTLADDELAYQLIEHAFKLHKIIGRYPTFLRL